eukprot:TRINITY_DN565_c0_g4_i1.p1 TRINITY_DN565_c0_g4~~TRINITY_DN565_c0_g4_i1.p1  ORF type:complete len:511 (-),score=145.79 TRINITY_DN565_c0_g4_i1:107-1534(-)
MEHDSIEAPLSSASFLLQRSDRFLSRLRIFEQKLGRISRLTRKTISRKGSVEYPVLLADAEVYWMEFEVAWKTYFEEYDVLMRDAKHLIGSGYIDSSQAMMIEDAVEACSHRVSTCQSLMGKTMRLIGSVRRIASSKGVQHNPVVDLLRDFRLRAFSPKRPRPNRRRELRPPPTPATSSRTLVKQQLRKLHEHEREETRASGGNHHTRHGKWVVRDADLVEGDDESPRKSTSVRRMRRDRGRIRSEDEANEAYDTYRPLDRETGRHAVGAEVIDRYLSQSDRDRVHGIQHGRKRQVRRQDDHETLSEKWNERDHVRVDDASDDKEEEEEEEEEEYIMSCVPTRILVPPHAPCLEGYTAFPDAMLPTEVEPLMKRQHNGHDEGDEDGAKERIYRGEKKRIPRRPIYISVDDPLHLGGYTDKTKELLERAYRMQYHSRRMREEKKREREREKKTSQSERNHRVRRRDQLGFIRRPTQ